MDEEIFKISKNLVRAKALKEMAEERLSDVNKENKTYKIVEQYYEIIKELLTALLLKKGLKSENHECLISYCKKNYPLLC